MICRSSGGYFRVGKEARAITGSGCFERWSPFGSARRSLVRSALAVRRAADCDRFPPRAGASLAWQWARG